MSLVGKQYGNYRLVSLLGSGGYADVYLGEHVHLGNKAAVKLLNARLSKQDHYEFQAEARLLAKLSHPLIVHVIDFGITAGDGLPYLVMDYAPNGSLRKRHPKGERVPLPMIITYVQQVGEALQYAHDQRLIHRDIKPENMLLGRNNEVLLSDFGIALQAVGTLDQSLQNVLGTVAYMAPEQLQGKPRPASDQYSLGVVVYGWLCGVHPFTGTFMEIASQHMMAEPPPLRQKNPDVSAEVERVVLTALSKDPRQRFASIRAFVNALRQAVPSSPRSPSWPGLSDMPTYMIPSDLIRQAGFTPPPPSTLPAQPDVDILALTPPYRNSVSSIPMIGGEVSSSVPPNTSSAISRRALLIRGALILGIAGAAGGTALMLSNREQPKPVITRAISSDGTMFGINAQHTRVVPIERKVGVSNVQNLRLVWKSYLGGAISISSPTVVDGIIYVGSTNSHVYAVRASDGAIVWGFMADNEIFSSPAVAGNGVFFGSNDKHIYGITKNNEVVWQFSTNDGVPGSPVIANGILYVGSSDSSFYALNAATGSRLWVKQTGSGITSSPVIVDNRVYFGSFDHYVYALDATTGREIWKTPTNGGIFSSPSVVDGVVYIGGHDTYVYAFNALNGQQLWKVKTDDKVNSSPAVWNNTVFIGSKDANLYAIDLSGKLLWKKAVTYEIASSPTIANGVLYVGSWDHYLYALDPINEGNVLWKGETLDGVESSPAVVDGRIYVGSRDGNLYAFGLPS
jgi:outer membrane protein assembly factor BamB/serine/threonine protein kinase